MIKIYNKQKIYESEYSQKEGCNYWMWACRNAWFSSILASWD